MATPGKQPKMMSSRLAGMKFMQRGAPSPPSTPSEPPAKKQRMSNGGFTSSPAPSPRTDNEIMEQAAAAQELKRAAAIEQEGASKGETKWYLSFKTPQTPSAESPLRIISAGYSALDSVDRKAAQTSDSEDDESAKRNMPGRKSFGKFGRGAPKKDDANADLSDPEDDEDEDEEEDDDEDDPTGVKSLINQGRKEATERLRAERKEEKRAKQAEALRLAKQRREREIDLNNVTSISGGGGSSNRSPMASMVCHQCSGKGHMARDCPQKKQNRPSKLRKSY
jgi:hypothetical protein